MFSCLSLVTVSVEEFDVKLSFKNAKLAGYDRSISFRL